jgi:cytoskeletal protein CcmA (bactofilin family)
MERRKIVRHVYHRRKGDVCVTDTLEVYGVLDGNITVATGGKLEIYGRVAGNVTIEPGGRLEHWGVIDGDLYDRGGTLDVDGRVNGRWYTPQDQPPITGDTTWLDTNAAVSPAIDANNERATILHLIAAQRISAEEGDALLAALSQSVAR